MGFHFKQRSDRASLRRFVSHTGYLGRQQVSHTCQAGWRERESEEAIVTRAGKWG